MSLGVGLIAPIWRIWAYLRRVFDRRWRRLSSGPGSWRVEHCWLTAARLGNQFGRSLCRRDNPRAVQDFVRVVRKISSHNRLVEGSERRFDKTIVTGNLADRSEEHTSELQ